MLAKHHQFCPCYSMIRINRTKSKEYTVFALKRGGGGLHEIRSLIQEEPLFKGCQWYLHFLYRLENSNRFQKHVPGGFNFDAMISSHRYSLKSDKLSPWGKCYECNSIMVWLSMTNMLRHKQCIPVELVPSIQDKLFSILHGRWKYSILILNFITSISCEMFT